jgi:hypothetical protein
MPKLLTVRVVGALHRHLTIAAAAAFIVLAGSGAALHDRVGDGLMTGHTSEACCGGTCRSPPRRPRSSS